MGRALGELHTNAQRADVGSRTAEEVARARLAIQADTPLPAPFTRVGRTALLAMLDSVPDSSAAVLTHGSPVVDVVVLNDSVAVFEPCGTEGWDPPERDLAIVIRSIAETFTSEVARTFLDGYEEAGGRLPHGPTLDWYGLLAAFR